MSLLPAHLGMQVCASQFRLQSPLVLMKQYEIKPKPNTGQGLVGPGSQLELQAGTTVVSRKHSQQKADLSLRLVVTPQAFPVRPWRPVGIIRLRTLALLGVPH